MGKGLAQCTHTRGTQRKPVPSIAGPQMSEDTNEVSRWGLRPEKLKKKKKKLEFCGGLPLDFVAHQRVCCKKMSHLPSTL